MISWNLKSKLQSKKNICAGIFHWFGMCFKMCFYGKMFTTSGKTDHRSHRGVAKKEQKLIRTQFHLLFFGTNNNTICFPPKKKSFFGGPYFGGEFWILRKLHWGGWRPSIPMISCKVANLNKSFERKKSLNGPGGFGGRSWDPNSVCQGPSKGSWNCLSVQGAPWIFKRFC